MSAWRSVLGLLLTIIQLIAGVVLLIKAVVSDALVNWISDFSGLTFSDTDSYQVSGGLDLSANIHFLMAVVILLLFGYILIMFVPNKVKKKELEFEGMDSSEFAED